MNQEPMAEAIESIESDTHDVIGRIAADRTKDTNNTNSNGDADAVASGGESVEPTKSGAERHTSGGYDVPSRRLSLLVEGRDYLKYRETFERLLFSEKMTPVQKDAKILKLAMTCLIEKMDEVSAATGEPFVRGEMLAG